MDTKRVIEESVPMLDDVLGSIGLHKSGSVLEFDRLREPFSNWLQQQVVQQEDFAFLVSLVAAFISEYLIHQAGAQRHISGQQILLRLPIQSGVAREFDPFVVAVGLVRERDSLAQFLVTVGS